MLSFWLAFLYANRPYYDKDRILCMANYLFQVQEKNRLAQRGLLKRFSLNCMGHQQTIEELRAEKSEKYEELKDKRGKTEFDEWFLRYRPQDTNKNIKDYKKSSKSKSKSKSNGKSKGKTNTKTKKKGWFY
jgi:hypothetical protein